MGKVVPFKKNMQEDIFSAEDLNICINSTYLRNVIYFLYSENLVLDRDIEKKLKVCKPVKDTLIKKAKKRERSVERLREKMGLKRRKKRKVLLSLKEEKNSIRITYGNNVLYVS